jgi:hypothetical protein
MLPPLRSGIAALRHPFGPGLHEAEEAVHIVNAFKNPNQQH